MGRFEAENIEFAYPTRTLFFERGESWQDPARSEGEISAT
jgi:hypothetical protein